MYIVFNNGSVLEGLLTQQIVKQFCESNPGKNVFFDSFRSPAVLDDSPQCFYRGEYDFFSSMG